MTRIFRVLCIDGGGMRGVYSAAYLQGLLGHYEEQRKASQLDFGAAFDLIAGTSTGAILACALAAAVPLTEVISLYRKAGPDIFPEKVPDSLPKLFAQYWKRRKMVAEGAKALESALRAKLGDETLGALWARRGIALAVPAVQMGDHLSWVFKTPHLPTLQRDIDYSLVDVCLATSAAPIFRSLAWIKRPRDESGLVFADGGLWANNPVLVGLVEALALTEPGDAIKLFCLGTCPPPSGDMIPKNQTNWGYREWRFGADVPGVAISAQQYAYDNMARMLLGYVSRPGSSVVRFPHGPVPGSMLQHLALDETSDLAMDALVQRAAADVSRALSETRNQQSVEGKLINDLFTAVPEFQR
jgi:hypothetical protein